MSLGDLRQELQGSRKRDSDGNPKIQTSYNVETNLDPEHNVMREIGVLEDKEEEMERKLAKILSVNVRGPDGECRLQMDEYFSTVKNVTDWTDFEPGKRECYKLFKMKSLNSIVVLGDSIFKAMKGKVTTKSLCQIMLLAYQLTDHAGNQAFGTIPEELLGTEISFRTISDNVLFTAESSAGLYVSLSKGDERSSFKMATAYSYLAASYMRLYTKAPENYEKIDKHLEERFTNFYDFPLPFENFHPDIQVIRSIKTQFDVNVTLKNTFYNFLYAGESSSYGKQLKEFLYQMHVSYTGMHPYTMFLRCMDAHKVSNKVLFNMLDNPGFHKELNALVTLFNTLHGSTIRMGKEKQMWKYARLFESTFYHDLQTKKCVLFVSTLANLYHIAVPIRATQNAHNIAGIKNLTLNMKYAARAIANIGYMRIMKSRFVHDDFAGVSTLLDPSGM